METLKAQLLQAINQVKTATADELVRILEQEHITGENKPLIADVHALLNELANSGQIKSTVKDGDLYYASA